jgi:LPXTG-motif cell wall-anchored protein
MSAQQNNATSDQQTAGSNLPQTASPLPLLGLLGLGSFGAGLLSRRKK